MKQNNQASSSRKNKVFSFRRTHVELRKKENTQEIERLLIALFEEIKINYVRGITEVEIESVVEEAEKLNAELKLEGSQYVSDLKSS